MDFTLVDGYLLGEPISKAAVIDAFLSERSPLPAAAPFYRALEAVGVRAADEALLALRLVLSGREPTDDRVRRLRALSGVARAATNGDGRALAAIRKRDAAVLHDVPCEAASAEVVASARAAYAAELD
jgi:ribose 1,5-bisphosphokinase PhnN